MELLLKALSRRRSEADLRASMFGCVKLSIFMRTFVRCGIFPVYRRALETSIWLSFARIPKVCIRDWNTKLFPASSSP